MRVCVSIRWNEKTTLCCTHNQLATYCIAITKFWWGKTWANRSFQSFGKENVGKFTNANIGYFSDSGIWLGKILANGIRFAKVFPCQNLALYGYYVNMYYIFGQVHAVTSS